jgi:drug/metabolite transporter (DMT)-like permease
MMREQCAPHTTFSPLPYADTAPPTEADMTLNYIVLLVLCGSLVCGFELVKLLEGEFPALTMAAARALLAAMAILFFCLLARQPVVPAFRRSAQLALVGVLGVGTLWAMVSLGERHVDPELAMLLVCIVPIATLVITALPPIPSASGGPHGSARRSRPLAWSS